MIEKNNDCRIPLTKKLNMEDVAVLLLSIRNNIETTSNPLPHIDGSKFREFLMENTIVPDFQLQVLLNETRDVLDRFLSFSWFADGVNAVDNLMQFLRVV